MNEIEIRRTVNKKLVAFMLLHGVKPIRLELSDIDKSTIIYVYNTKESQELFKVWHELKNKNKF